MEFVTVKCEPRDEDDMVDPFITEEEIKVN